MTSEPASGPDEPPAASDLAFAAINLENATTSWTLQRSDELFGVSEVFAGDGRVIVRSGYCGNLVAAALDPTSGTIVWRTDPDLLIIEGSRGVPGLIAKGIVVMPATIGLHGLDAATGQAKWTSEGGFLVAESESVVVLWSPVAGLVHVLDRLTGAEQWSLRLSEQMQPISPASVPAPAPADFVAPPSVSGVASGDRVYLRVDSEVTAYDALSGSQAWTTSVGRSQQAVLLGDFDVLVTGSQGGLVALDAGDGIERWSVPNNAGVEELSLNEARLADGNLYLSLASSVTALDLVTGKPKWQAPSEAGGLPVAAGNRRVIVSGGGRLHVMDAATGTELWDTSAPAYQPSDLDAAIYAVNGDSLYLAWFCGGG